MPRSAREPSPYDIYHVMLRGVGRMRIFEDDGDRLFFLAGLKRLSAEEGCTVLSWCLMDNHVHLLLHASLEEMAKFIKRVANRYAYRFNKKYDHIGHLFQDRYRSMPVNSERQFLTVVRYIHRNPIRDGVSKTLDWKWSSYREFVHEPFLSDTEYVLSMFGSKEQFVAILMMGDEQVGSEAPFDVEPYENPYDTVAKRASEAIGIDALHALGSLGKKERNEKLRLLKQAGLSIRQIEQLTGIGRWIIANA